VIAAANTAPTIVGVTASTTIDDTATANPFSGVTVADADANNVTVSVTLDIAAKGVFTPTSLTASGFVSAGSGVYTLALGTAAAATTKIQQLVFDPTDNRVAPASTESTTFTIAVNDGTATTSNATTTVVSTSVNDAPTLLALENNLMQQATATSIALTGASSTALRGLASDGVHLYVNDASASIQQFDMAGKWQSSSAVANLGDEHTQMAYSQGYLFARKGSTLYRISTTDWSSTAVSLPADKPLPTAQSWITGSLFSLPDGRLGTQSTADGSGNMTVRFYTLSADGLTLTWSEDKTVTDTSGFLGSDHHGTVSDGSYLYVINNGGGYKAYSLTSGTLAYDGTGWNMKNPALGIGTLANPTFVTRDPLSGALIAGDYEAARIVKGADSLATISLTGATSGAAYEITYAALAAKASEADVDGGALAFRIESVTAGTLTKGGSAVVAGSTLLAAGESLVWTSGTSGTLAAFSVKAWDGALASTQTTAVSVVVASVPVAQAAPTITAGTTTAFTEQTPVALANTITINDVNGDADWTGGKLKAQITANAEASDTLYLPSTNPGGSAIWLDATSNKLMSGNIQIGTADAASVTNGTAWTLTFNANATNALVQATGQALLFNNTSNTPGTSSRTVTLTATDKNATSNSATQTVTVAAVNDAPTLSTFTTLTGATQNAEKLATRTMSMAPSAHLWSRRSAMARSRLAPVRARLAPG